jgi:hypothetical protein
MSIEGVSILQKLPQATYGSVHRLANDIETTPAFADATGYFTGYTNIPSRNWIIKRHLRSFEWHVWRASHAWHVAWKSDFKVRLPSWSLNIHPEFVVSSPLCSSSPQFDLTLLHVIPYIQVTDKVTGQVNDGFQA